MSFQAYIDNIKAKTGKTPEELKSLAIKATVYSPDMNAAALVAWLKADFALGHGHSMAIWAYWKSKGWVEAPSASKGATSTAKKSATTTAKKPAAKKAAGSGAKKKGAK
jgi:hypothetical protein